MFMTLRWLGNERTVEISRYRLMGAGPSHIWYEAFLALSSEEARWNRFVDEIGKPIHHRIVDYDGNVVYEN